MERYLGQPLEFDGHYANTGQPGMLPALIANGAWEALEAGVTARLLVQVDPLLSSLFDYDPASDTVIPHLATPMTSFGDAVSSALAGLATAIGPLSPTTLAAWVRASYALDAFRVSAGMSQDEFAGPLSQETGMGGIGVVQDAVAQGLVVSYGPDSMLTVSNAATDGILADYYGTPYGRESGLDYSTPSSCRPCQRATPTTWPRVARVPWAGRTRTLTWSAGA